MALLSVLELGEGALSYLRPQEKLVSDLGISALLPCGRHGCLLGRASLKKALASGQGEGQGEDEL